MCKAVGIKISTRMGADFCADTSACLAHRGRALSSCSEPDYSLGYAPLGPGLPRPSGLRDRTRSL